MVTRHPVFVLSKGRAERCLTARFLAADGVPFMVAVEPQEVDAYARTVGRDRLIVLPFRDTGTAMTVRNFLKDRSTAAGDARHWQLDDNIRAIRGYGASGKRERVDSGLALTKVEELVDGYANVGIAGLRHQAFEERSRSFSRNKQVYSCVLVDNSLPYRWRLIAHHDTDYSLQVLTGRNQTDCTILINAFCIEKAVSMSMGGGMTDTYAGDGRLRKCQALQRQWPAFGIKIVRRNGRPTVVTSHIWRHFTQPLIPKVSSP